MEINRDMFVDDRGRYRTQSLFLEIAYDTDALFTLKDYDHEYKGKTYPSLKRMFLEDSDPTEYIFATNRLAGWEHWQKISENKVLAVHINKWRFELELKLRSEGIKHVIHSARKKGNWLAGKFLAERGWEVRAGAGRPGKEEIERSIAIDKAIASEYEDDFARLKVINGGS